MQTSSRQPYLDWLRIMAILGVLVFHSAMAFVAEDEWHLKNKETSYLLMEFNFWLSRFRMPLLFFISGTVTYFMLKNRSGSSFIGLRFRRLFVPLLFGMLVIVPPQVYMERLTQGFHGSFFDFYPKVFEFEPYPNGNFSWHHLWFIFYLLVYDIVFTPVFKWSMREKGKRFLQKLEWVANGKKVYLIMLPGIIIFTSLIQQYPGTNDFIHDLCYVFYWLFFLLGGFFCIANPKCMDSIERNRRTSFALAFLTILLINYLRWNGLEPESENSWTTYAYLSTYPMTAWFWVMTAVGYGKKYLNRKTKIQHYLNQAVYPFYILHQTVIVVIVYYVIQVQESILMKYLFTVVLSLIVSVSIYHLFIRPYKVMRFLFGMKPKKENKKEMPVIAEEVAVLQTA